MEASAAEIKGIAALAIAAGALYCFLGYRMLKFIVGLTGFLLAGGVAIIITAWLTEGRYPLILAAAGLIGGTCGAAAMFFLYRAGIFFLGVLGGALVAYALVGPGETEWATSIVVGSAVFGGLLALLVERTAMTFATAAMGAWATVYGIAFFFLGTGSKASFDEALARPENMRILFISWTLLAIAGAAAQFASHRPPQS